MREAVGGAAQRNGTRLRDRLEERREVRATPVPRQPIRIEYKYSRAILAILDRVQRLIMTGIGPEEWRLIYSYLAPGGPVSSSLRRGDAVDPLGPAYLPPEIKSFFASLGIKIETLLASPEIADLLRELAGEVSTHNKTELRQLTGIRWEDTPGTQILIDKWMVTNTNLIKSVSFQRLNDVRRAIAEPLAQGERVEDLSKRLESAFGLSESRALLIARDQTLKANADMNMERQRSAGVKRYKWSVSNDERVRGRPGGKWGPKPGKAYSGGDHWALRGQIFSYDNPPIVDPRTGRRDHPGKDFQCRCIAIPILDDLLSE